jgi:splicing factor 45
MSETASGDIAYALRPAMSQAASGDDAYARRVAMSQAAAGDRARQPTVSNQSPPAFAPAALPASEPPQTGFIPPPSRALPGAPPPPPANIAPPPPPPPSNIPGFGSFGIPAAVPSAPPVQCPSPAPALAAAPSATEDFQKMLQEKMLAASAIAAKYAHLSPVAPAPAPNAAPSPPSAPAASLSDEAGGSFAEKSESASFGRDLQRRDKGAESLQ